MSKDKLALALIASSLLLVPSTGAAQSKEPGRKVPSAPQQGGNRPSAPSVPSQTPTAAGAVNLPPDLVSEVEFSDRCALTARVRNAGLGRVPDKYQGNFNLYLTAGDRQGGGVFNFDQVREPGQSVSFSNANYWNVLGPQPIRVRLTGDREVFGPPEPNAHTFVKQLSPSGRADFNQTLTCPTTPPKFDVVLEDVRVNPDCSVVVRIKNLGPETVPQNEGLAFNAFVGEQQVQGYWLWSNPALPSGSSYEFAGSWQQLRDLGPQAKLFTFTLGPAWGMDVDPKNNSKTLSLSCPAATK